MLRTTYTRKLSQKDELILKTNHNFFVRAAIATLARITVASFLLCCAIFLIALIAAASKIDANVITLINIVLYLALFIYIIAAALNLLTVYKRLNEIESSILDK